MSRYRVAFSTPSAASPNGEYHYGFDGPLQQYFLMTYLNGEFVSETNSRSEIIELLTETDADQSHVDALVLDLPF